MTLRRVLRYGLISLLVAVVAAVLLLRHYAQPEKIAAALIAQTRDRLGLELSFAGDPRYAFWPKLRLELDDAQLRVPGAKTPLLTVAHTGVTLPWSSLRTSTLAIETLRLTEPALDLDETNAWLAASPAGAVPDIRAGIVIAKGNVQRDGKPFVVGLSLDGELDLPALAAWWRALAAHANDASPLPPLPMNATIERIDAGGATLSGLVIETENPP